MANLDSIFHGLADPTRRAVIARLASGPAAVSELAAPHDMALPSFLKHLKVLEAGGWIESDKAGVVVEVLVDNEMAVEFDQPLFAIE